MKVELTGTIKEISDLRGDAPYRSFALEVPDGNFSNTFELDLKGDKASGFNFVVDEEVKVEAFLGGYKNQRGYYKNTLKAWTVEKVGAMSGATDESPF